MSCASVSLISDLQCPMSCVSVYCCLYPVVSILYPVLCIPDLFLCLVPLLSLSCIPVSYASLAISASSPILCLSVLCVPLYP